MKYSVAKHNAQLFANERSIPIFIAKSNKLNDYKIEFENKTTEHFKIIETVMPCITFKTMKGENK